ncbi:GNAT family N-acetyltransferase [Rhodococcus sp. (in: high G+C Gram-positive bacteria)]|uniref:GNAT family N-acetyltransferase n=1 Tax=Rhodococcus sp. TaxID=1831 RepID=UPI001A2DF430|nr:GNAT family N-acetyltransferase [Rhodococcus sp. (in: high G+C Gram-positive bacteria)]MBJ7477850.1 N-acetyltransferase [Rhodococcus sp. (in: high G+C Gram-positive bacteria)]
MAQAPENTVITDNPSQSRYEIHADGDLAGIEDYTTSGDVVSFNHTEIYPAFEGFGLAGVLVRQALDDLRARGLKVHPVCPYVVKFLDKHPEYQDLIS